MIIWNQLHELPTHKTGDLRRLLEPWELSSALILDHYEPDDDDNADDDNAAVPYRGVPVNLWTAAANLPRITVGNDHDAAVYTILKHETLILTLSALEQLESRLKGEVY